MQNWPLFLKFVFLSSVQVRLFWHCIWFRSACTRTQQLVVTNALSPLPVKPWVILKFTVVSGKLIWASLASGYRCCFCLPVSFPLICVVRALREQPAFPSTTCCGSLGPPCGGCWLLSSAQLLPVIVDECTEQRTCCIYAFWTPIHSHWKLIDKGNNVIIN